MCWQCDGAVAINPPGSPDHEVYNPITGFHLIEKWFWLPRIKWTASSLVLAWGCFWYLGYKN